MANLQNVAAVVQREQDALALESRIAQCPPFVAVNNLNDVALLPSKLRWNHATTVTALQGAKGTAFVVDCASLNATALWVGTKNKDHRKDYLLFLNTTYQLGISAIPPPYDVDHLYNRA